MSYLQAIVIALVQGVTELFPVSSLGHSVLVPAWIGGDWETLVTQSSQASSESSFYLAYIVALHCATALALVWFFRADWVRIVRGFLRSAARGARERRLSARDADEKLAWLIVVATIPVGVTGLALEHVFRTVFAKPVAASAFLFVNGLVLLAGERLRRRTASAPPVVVPIREPAHAGVAAAPAPRAATTATAANAGHGAAAPPRAARSAAELAGAHASDRRIAGLSMRDGLLVGLFQVTALLPGISRSGVTMVGGLWRGLSHEDAARFAFLLATPVILAAGVLKLPGLLGPTGDPIRGQVVAGSIVCAIASYCSVRFLVRWFQTRTLTPFAVYCLIAGAASLVRFVA